MSTRSLESTSGHNEGIMSLLWFVLGYLHPKGLLLVAAVQTG